jgi:DNA-binding CsgD family transcriptional regulator
LIAAAFVTIGDWRRHLNLVDHDEELATLFQSLEHSPDAVFVTDRTNHIVFWNDAARFLLGFTADEAVGGHCDHLLGGSDTFGNRYCTGECPIMRIANRGEIVRNFSLNLRTKESQHVVALVSVIQLRVDAPDDYFLVHLLRPNGESTEQRPTYEPAASSRPRLVAARESVDVRARKLTGREVEVLGMLAAGRSTPEIAERLHISQLTARSHIQNILEKLEVHSKVEAVAFAFQKNLI